MSKQIKTNLRVKELGEVYTAHREVNAMCDLIASSIDKLEDTILEPACGNGNFLEEILRRRIVNFKSQKAIKDYKILVANIYGIDIDEQNVRECKERLLNVLKEFIVEEDVFWLQIEDILNKNIIKADTLSEFKEIKFVSYVLGQDSLESKNILGAEVLDGKFKFNTIIGNPPYQQLDGGFAASATPLYHKFVELSKKLNPDYLCMIIPARWFIGGRGLDNFRKDMLSDRKLVKLVDHHSSLDCFPGVDIEGGVCYFLWSNSYRGSCRVVSIRGGKTSESDRVLDEFDVFVRYQEAISVLKKVLLKKEDSIVKIIETTKPFGIRTNFKEYVMEEKEGFVKFYGNKVVGYVEPKFITKNVGKVKDYKVLISAAYGMGRSAPYKVLGSPFVTGVNTCCSETYLVCGSFKKEVLAKNLKKYVETKFFRFLTLLRKGTQHNPPDRFRFVPIQDFEEEITDVELYKKYGLTKEEIDFIEEMVR